MNNKILNTILIGGLFFMGSTGIVSSLQALRKEQVCVAIDSLMEEERTEKLFRLLNSSELTNGNEQCAMNLIACGVNFNTMSSPTQGNDSDSQLCGTLLHMTVGKGHLDIIRALFEKGASLDVCDAAENTPLHWALDKFRWYISKQRTQNIEEAIKKAMDVIDLLITTQGIALATALNAVNKNGNTPLDFSVKTIMNAVYEKNEVHLKDAFTIAKKLIIGGANKVKSTFAKEQNLRTYLACTIGLRHRTQCNQKNIGELSQEKREIFQKVITLITQWIKQKKAHPEIDQIDQLEIKETRQLEASIIAQMSTI
jgi:ankyrin repeat protein